MHPHPTRPTRILSRPCICWAASGSRQCPTCGWQLTSARTQPAANAGPPAGCARSAIRTGRCEPGPAHPGRRSSGSSPGVLLMESYGAMVEAARAGGRAIPELWPLGTEALALAMEVSVLEAKRLGHVARAAAVMAAAGRLGRPVHPAPGRRCSTEPWSATCTAGATPVWLLGSFAVLSLLYRADGQRRSGGDRPRPAPSIRWAARPAPGSAEVQRPGAAVLTKRAQAERRLR